MSKLERRLSLVANLAVVIGIIFLAAEMRQNTQLMQAQIRDSLTEKQMEYLGWVATNPELAEALAKEAGGGRDALTSTEAYQIATWVGGQMREWENSYYQSQQGLFTAEDFEARTNRWRLVVSRDYGDAFRRFWEVWREAFSPDFRGQIDRIMAAVDPAQ